MKPRLSGTASLLLVGNLTGFFIVSYLPGMLGVESRAATVPFRAFLLGLALYMLYRLLATRSLRVGFDFTTAISLFFWSAYSVRFIADAGFLQVPLGRPPDEIALFLFGATLPAFIAFYCIRDIRLYKPALGWAVLLLGICCYLAIRENASDAEVLKHLHGANDVLNHITYGHMGLTTIILGLFVLLNVDKDQRFRFWVRYLSIGAILLGVYTILSAGSKGAAVAAVLLIPMTIWFGMKQSSKWLILGILIALVVTAVFSIKILNKSGGLEKSLYSAAAYNSSSYSIYARQDMMGDAWREYQDNPILGSSIVERKWLSYPHNAVLESFMATGTFGGAAFVIMMAIATWRAFRIMRRDVSMSWLPLCFFQQLIGAMFSGGIYGDFILFGLTGIMLGVELPNGFYATAPATGYPDTRISAFAVGSK